MSRLAIVDCPSGLAGNMLLAALFDLGLPQQVVDLPLAALGLERAYRLGLEERQSAGLRGLHLEVTPLEQQPPHRHWSQLRLQIQQAAWPELLKSKVLEVFGLLATAEAAVHGIEPEKVHFHEVGAVDSLVDVVGVCAGLIHFGVDGLVCTPPPAGHGSVQTAHGILPLPAPAVLELARLKKVPLASSGSYPAGELTTPTGLALVACWVQSFSQAPDHVPASIGVGLGSRQFAVGADQPPRPNLLRITLASPPQLLGQREAGDSAQPSLETLVVQQAQVDDATPEDLAYLLERLRQAGALEVFSQAIAMKKGRPGQLVTALVRPEMAAELRLLWWQHSSSLGLRESTQNRWVLPRRSRRLQTPWGEVGIKEALLPDGRWRAKAEHADLVALSESQGLALDQVRAAVEGLL
ncbi:nickel pincer cofactor biosynthesis protein LarC [Cyanobium sp. HWJ4-Hawea]|uniref:nickel pincer cofactor biosynthesis protein LarC n=1 Tax=unclassified Cyanobium TaxID=2627006 RepID=UPI0020CC6C2A|nr:MULTISPECIES: nickel pincer cofactor biosynthesis protein LarC [unclassified Cyanobium]MCP9775015.1 nickel pincer cofactor biosynthesis protein LarC [Cyanobium sp. WAJ14-Wanaka]MCP9809657.1 nickel pincer cofactor biosynthesis protein LarC [Cyanobium sp. HWJ4-Hawea]